MTSGAVIVQGVSWACSASFCAGFAEEGQCDLAHGVESGQEGSDCESNEDRQMTVGKSIRKDLILRPEARGNDRETGKRKAADEEGPECDRHLLAQAAHIEHILWINFVIARVQDAMLHAVNDRAGAKEEQRFEEGVCDQVEDCRDIRADAERGDHEAKL